jgi:hypothetical protein
MYEQPVMYCPDSHRRPLHGNRVPVFCSCRTKMEHFWGLLLPIAIRYRVWRSAVSKESPFSYWITCRKKETGSSLGFSLFEVTVLWRLSFFFGGGGCRRDQFSSAVQEKTKAVVVDSLLYLASVFISSDVFVLPCLMVYECADDVQHSRTNAMWWLKLGCE